MTNIPRYQKYTLIVSIAALIISALIGSGAYWQYKKSKTDEKRIEIEYIKQSVELRDKINNSLIKINSLSTEYVSIKNNDEISELRRKQIKSEFDVLKNDIWEYENQLAKIENRNMRQIDYPYPFEDTTPPGSPFKISLKIEKSLRDIIFKNVVTLIIVIVIFRKFGALKRHISRNSKKYIYLMVFLDLFCFIAYFPQQEFIQPFIYLKLPYSGPHEWIINLLRLSFLVSALALLLKRSFGFFLYYVQVPLRLWFGIYSFWFVCYFLDWTIELPALAKTYLIILCIFLEGVRLMATIIIHKYQRDWSNPYLTI